MKVCVVVGTRPEIIKMSVVVHELIARGMPFTLVHSGQHYDDNLSDVFFRELELPQPDFNLNVGSGSQAVQTASAMVKLEAAFQEIRPDVVLVEGDTNTVLAGALASAKLGINVGHVEAGLRSYDTRMPEEHNRRLTDHLSSYLFAPTSRAATTLQNEKCWGQIYVTGNTVIDACVRYGAIAKQRSAILDQIDFRDFALATAHRAENVDDPGTLSQLVELFTRCPLPVVFPIHPRTIAQLKKRKLFDKLEGSANIKLLTSTGYLDFLQLLISCKFVLTDSGGIQEEITAPNIRKKAFVLRDSTERPEAVESGYAELVGTDADLAINRINIFLEEGSLSSFSTPFGDGKAGVHIVDLVSGLLSPRLEQVIT